MTKSQFSGSNRWSRPVCVGIMLGLAGVMGNTAQADALPGGEVKGGVQLAAGTTHEAASVLEEQAKTAKTPADHERLATQFDAHAVHLDDVAAKHKRLAVIYRAQVGKDFAQSMSSHCERLAKSNSEEAEEMRALARLHRALAQVPDQ